MTRRIQKAGFVLLALILSLFSSAQSPCASEHHTDFDFWLGTWQVTDSTGAFAGSNTIERRHEGCLIHESWKGKSGGTGSSYNYYDPKTDMWHQVWVDQTGGILNLSGGFDGKKMVLRSEFRENEEVWICDRITWTPQSDGTVIQLWELLNEEDVPIRILFKGIYTKDK